MKKINVLLLALLFMLAPCFAKAGELSAEEKNYFKEITAEWEWAYGPHKIWDYRTIGLFCQLYKNYPNAETAKEITSLPTLPYTEVNISCEEATNIAKAFLMEYDSRITASYLDSMTVGTTFFNLSHTEESLSARCDRIWIIKFYENTGSENYLMKCDAYINADNGQVFMIDLMLDRTNEEDNNCQTIEF